MEKKEIITTLSIVGDGAADALVKSGADPANFVLPIYKGEHTVETSFGSIGVFHTTQIQNGSELRVVQLDCTNAPGLLSRSSAVNPYHTIFINREGTGTQQVKRFEIFVATNHFSS